jgi:hypothetical protein
MGDGEGGPSIPRLRSLAERAPCPGRHRRIRKNLELLRARKCRSRPCSTGINTISRLCSREHRRRNPTSLLQFQSCSLSHCPQNWSGSALTPFKSR